MKLPTYLQIEPGLTAGTVDGHALDLLPEMIDRYAPQTIML